MKGSTSCTPVFYCVLLAISSGLILAAAFPPWDVSLLAWIALIPLLTAIEGRGPLSILAMAWLQGLAFCLTSGAWAFSTLYDYAHLPMTSCILEFGSGCLMLAGFGACATAAAKFVSGSLSVPLVLTLPIAWTAGEWFRVEVPFSYPWNLVGYALYRDIHLIQFAEITGVYGVSAFIIYVNVALYTLLTGAGTGALRRMMLISLIAILPIIWVFGEIRLAQIDSAPVTGRLKIGLISGGLEPAKVHPASSRAEAFKLYRTNTELALRQHPDLIVWPETAGMYIFQAEGRYSLLMAEDAAYHDSLVELARASATPILFGALAFRRSQDKLTMFNRAYLLTSTGAVAGYYDKVKLVPFGEYLPMQWLLRGHVTTIAGHWPLASGVHDRLFDIHGHKVGIRICYESVFPGLTRQAIKAGAEVLINISNDAWYGKMGAAQALAMTSMRAVETRRPIVRVANLGFSALISAAGRIEIAGEFSVPGWSVRDVKWPANRTVYVRYGDVLALVCLALTLLGMLLSVLTKFTEKVPQIG